MAKRRIYEIAREKGLQTHELADRLRAAGVEVKSNLSSVEESDVDRILLPPPAPAPSAPAAAEKTTPRKQPATQASATRKAAGRPADTGDTGPKVAEARAESRAAAKTSEAAAATGRPAESRSGEGRPQQGQAKGRPSRGGRNLRLKDLPTVVGPDVPVRKGVKPSGTVRIKGEEPKPAPAKPEETRSAPARTDRAPASAPPSRAEGLPPRGSKPGGQPWSKPARSHGPVDRADAVEEPAAGGDAGKKRPGAALPAGRARRGEDKPARRRVIIDSQAGRKGAKLGGRDRKGSPVREAERPVAKGKPTPGTLSPVTLPSGATVKDLADALELSPGELIKTLMKLGEMVTITQSLTDEAILILAEEFERKVEIQHAAEETEEVVFVDDPADLVSKAPVVTVMGHVDHGKTSLLDAIRETEVAASETGGITQHIGAYQVHHRDKRVTFIDTPGHEAFTAMRARGAGVTDVAVIVVAANDGVMPQTVEAIHHARAAEVPMLVAINKIDLPDANIDHVKHQLADQGLVPEEWGGDTVMVAVSAKKRMNLTDLMDMILLVAEVQELRVNPKAHASGVVIEAQLDVGRGPVATVLVQRGTLRVGDAVVSGESYGKVKAMFDFKGENVKTAGPAMPVQILGFGSVPAAGDPVQVVRDERVARQRAEGRVARLRQEQLAKSRAGTTSLDEFYRRLKEGAIKELLLVLKGDVGGSVEALEQALANISHPEVKVRVIHSGVGGINESDIMLAAASQAVVIGFNVRPSVAAKALAEQEGVDVRTYRVIYKAIEDVQAALIGMLEPEYVEEEIGTAEVRQVFHASRIGTIAGTYVIRGKITRNAKVRVVSNGKIVYEGSIASLKRFKDDVREVTSGYECGILLERFDDLKEGDIIEAYEIREVARTE